MTEAEWLTSSDPRGMLYHLAWHASERKLRLYCVEVVRPFADLFFHPTSRVALAAAEDVVEGRCGEQELLKAQGEARAALAFRGYRTTSVQHAAATAASAALEVGASNAASSTSLWISLLFADREVEEFTKANERRARLQSQLQPWLPEDELLTFEDEKRVAYRRGQATGDEVMATLLRDIFGNPFHPVAVDPAWRSEAAVGIARGIYDDRAFERLPILADAMQEAGCEHPDILSHCREPGTHVRGCWVVDVVLDKS